MIDPRFYEALGPATVRALAVSMEVGGDAERLISGLAPADRAGPDDLCYFEPKGGAQLASAPGACVVTPSSAHLAARAEALILSDHPRAAFARLAPKLAAPRAFAPGVAIDPAAELEEGVSVGAGAVIGAGARLGGGARIGPHAVIGPGVTIGRRTQIGPHASVQFALVGDDVTVLAGARIGETGFGVASGPGGVVDMPHFGRVVVQDRVVIGANTCVDRGVFDDTTIGEDAKIDNLCQIAHNVTIGRGVLIAAFAGISGSTTVGDGVMMGGRVGVYDHIKIGPRAVLAAAAVVMQDVPAGETYAGFPAKPIRKWLREAAWLNRKAGTRE